MTAPKEPRQSGVPKNGRPAAVPQPAFQMTADEMAYAVRFFSACRRMAEGTRRNCLNTSVLVVEDMTEKYPLHPVAKLRLVGGGGK